MAKRTFTPRPVAVKKVLQDLLNPGDWQSLQQRRQIREVWEQVVPAPLRAQTRLLEVRRQELWVEVSASPWGQELQFLKPQILHRLLEVLGPGIIRDVRSRVGKGGED
jgi:hypothetical protein